MLFPKIASAIGRKNPVSRINAVCGRTDRWFRYLIFMIYFVSTEYFTAHVICTVKKGCLNRVNLQENSGTDFQTFTFCAL